MVESGRAVGLQYIDNWKTHALIVNESQIVGYQFTKEEATSGKLYEAFHCKDLQVQNVQVREVGLDKEIGNQCYELPFYSATFPYILAAD